MNTNAEEPPEYRLSLTGKELYPSSSVLASGKIDADGRIDFSDVPQTRPLVARLQRRRISNRPHPLHQPNAVEIRLTYDDLAGKSEAHP